MFNKRTHCTWSFRPQEEARVQVTVQTPGLPARMGVVIPLNHAQQPPVAVATPNNSDVATPDNNRCSYAHAIGVKVRLLCSLSC